MELVYESSDKHGKPWQPGRKGSLCPPDVRPRAQQLLAASVEGGKQRYAADHGRAFCAQQHDPARNRWHGYPVGWQEVPYAVRKQLLQRGQVTRRDLKRHWETHT